MNNEKLTFADYNNIAQEAIKRNGKLNNRQIDKLAQKAVNDIGGQFFFDLYVGKYGLPPIDSPLTGKGELSFAKNYFYNLFKN